MRTNLSKSPVSPWFGLTEYVREPNARDYDYSKSKEVSNRTAIRTYVGNVEEKSGQGDQLVAVPDYP